MGNSKLRKIYFTHFPDTGNGTAVGLSGGPQCSRKSKCEMAGLSNIHFSPGPDPGLGNSHVSHGYGSQCSRETRVTFFLSHSGIRDPTCFLVSQGEVSAIPYHCESCFRGGVRRSWPKQYFFSFTVQNQALSGAVCGAAGRRNNNADPDRYPVQWGADLCTNNELIAPLLLFRVVIPSCLARTILD